MSVSVNKSWEMYPNQLLFHMFIVRMNHIFGPQSVRTNWRPLYHILWWLQTIPTIIFYELFEAAIQSVKFKEMIQSHCQWKQVYLK